MNNPALLFVLSLLGAGIGAYLGAYLKKKGENLATHEDIDKLVNQVAAVTTATKEIEAKISNDVWERQKKWEARRDALFQSIKELAAMRQAVMFLQAANAAVKATRNNAQWEGERMDAMKRWSEAATKLDQAMLLALLVCDERTKVHVRKVDTTVNQISATVLNGDTAHEQLMPQLLREIGELSAAIHAELFAEPALVTSLSSESSAAQAPAPPTQG